MEKNAKRLKWQTKKCQKSKMPNIIVQKKICQKARMTTTKKMAKGKKAKHADAINNAKVTLKIFHEYYAAF